MFSGVLNIYKPKGYTSHDIVNKVRRIAGMKKVGHTGTLDPMAEGVLPVCLGKATRIAEYLTGEEKEYIAEVTLGAETDTLDAEGEIIRECSVPEISEDMLQEVLKTFVGDLVQIPPMYSAIKRDGKPLYKYAREGLDFELPGRDISIYYIDLIFFEGEKLKIRVGCSKGTYIRSLARDLGVKLGSCGHLSSLIRSKSGNFNIMNAVTLETLQEEGVEKYLISIDEAIPQFTPVKLNEENSKKASLGNFVLLEDEEYNELVNSDMIKIFAFDGSLIAIGTLKERVLKPKKVFV